MSIEIIGVLFLSLMFGSFVYDFQKWLDRKTLTETQQWELEYKKDVPTVWN